MKFSAFYVLDQLYPTYIDIALYILYKLYNYYITILNIKLQFNFTSHLHLCLLNCFFPSSFMIKILYALLGPSILHVLLSFISHRSENLITFREEYTI